MRLYRPFTLLIALLGVWGCANAPEPAPEDAQPVASGVIALAPEVRATIQLETAVVTRQKLPLTLEALGDVTARSEAQAVVHAPFDGVLADVRARVGVCVSW
jgi:multidrug resistance efflux pump